MIIYPTSQRRTAKEKCRISMQSSTTSSIGPGEDWQLLQDPLQAVILRSWMFCHCFWMIIGSKINTPHCPCRKSPVVLSSGVITHQRIPYFLERARTSWTPPHFSLFTQQGKVLRSGLFQEAIRTWVPDLLCSFVNPISCSWGVI